MKLILFILLTALINVTCPGTALPCDLGNDQYEFRFWKITQLKERFELEGTDWNGIKIGEHKGLLKFFNNQKIQVIYENSVPMQHSVPLPDNNVVMEQNSVIQHYSVDIQYQSVNFNNLDTENCVLEFTSKQVESMNIKVHFSFNDSKCPKALENALNGFSADPYGFHYVYRSKDWKKSTGYNDVSKLGDRELVLAKFSIQNFIAKHLPEESLAFDILFFEESNLAMVEYVIVMKDDILKFQFHFNYGQCGNACIQDLRTMSMALR
jgi:hypothetical protein